MKTPIADFAVNVRTAHLAGLRITQAVYPPRTRLPRHRHAQPYLCLVAAGGFEERLQRRSETCTAGTVIWNPSCEEHDDTFGESGARCWNVEFTDAWGERLAQAADAWTPARSGEPTWLATRIMRELSAPDAASSLTLEGLVCALIGEISRTTADDRRRPVWLSRARDRLHAEYREPPSVAELAGDAGVHRSHFARAFRRNIGCTVAEFGAYPFPRFALVEIPSGLAERAGFAGASVDGAIFTTSEYLDQPFNAAYYGHEIGHQWWGVTIRPVGPRGTWMLSEGMAQYGALRAVEAIAGADAARTFRQREYPGYFGQGGELYFRTVAEGHDAPLADLPTGEEWSRDIADSKGFMVLNALANEMGRDRLRAAVREILRDFRDRRLSWDDFLDVVTRAAGRDLSWFYAQWFQRIGAPELIAEVVHSARQIRVRQPREPYRLTVELAIAGAGCGPRLKVTVALSDERVPLPDGCRAN